MMLITGGSGQLGTAFGAVFPEATFPTRAELDLAAVDDVYPKLAELHPDAIINCAAYTAVDAAEDDEETAWAVNAGAVGEMARYAGDHSIPFVTYSTDYVFAGNGTRPYVESDPTDPINVYGRTKREGELAALAYSGSLVIRTSWVISPTHPNFVATMIRLVTERELTVVDDQRGCPTITTDLAAATRRALDVAATGLLHLTNQGETTWFHLARRAVELAGLGPERISPCGTDAFSRPAPRPAYSVLGSERLEDLSLDPLPAWDDSLPGVVSGLIANGIV